MKKDVQVDARELAAELLLELEKGREYENTLLKNVLDKYDYLDTKQKAFIKRLVEGVTERRIQLDYLLECFSSIPVRKMKPFIRCLLRMGAYQILFMDGIPDSAACNEAVKLADRKGFGGLKRFVNGVLRSICRSKDALSWPDEKKEPLRRLSVLYSMPEWIVQMWDQEYGRATTETMLRALLDSRPVTIRLSPSLAAQQREELLDALEKHGCAPKAHPLYPHAYCLERCDGVARLPGFAEGWFAVQDVGSMLAVECAQLGALEKGTEDVFVLDVCAAPGGKAAHAAQLLCGVGTVLARDVSDKKVSYIEENAERLGLSNLRTQVWDARRLDGQLVEKADVVLADLPCSGLGVIGRKADIKYRVSPESLKEVCALQKDILETVWRYVKPGGTLVYSTCTVNPEENQAMAEWFVKHHPFQPKPLAGALPKGCAGADEPEGCIQLLPGIHDTDGFFISCFTRKRDGSEE